MGKLRHAPAGVLTLVLLCVCACSSKSVDCTYTPSGTLSDGKMSGVFDFGSQGTFPLSATIDATARTIKGTITFHDASQTYNGTIDGTIDTGGTVSGTWDAGTISGSFQATTNDRAMCGTWSNNAGQSGNLRLSR